MQFIILFFYLNCQTKGWVLTCPSKFRDKPEGCERNLGVVTLKSEHFAGGVDTAKFRTAEKPESEQKKPTSAKHWKAYSVSEKEFKEAAECETRLDK